MGTVRRLETRVRRDDGFTLAELLVVMMLMGIVGSMALFFVTTSADAIVKDQSRLDSLNIATVGMNQLSKAIRAGTEIEQAGTVNLPVFSAVGSESMTFYSFTGTVPSQVAYEINAGRELIQRSVPADPASGPTWEFTGTPSTRIVARQIPVPAPGDPPLFAYHDGTGALMTLPVGPAGLSQIERVTITLTVQTDLNQDVPPAVLVNQVGLPNVGIARR
jgi:prepilin-type N-terminal cleavage/methylation domain-containing protein